MSIIDDRELTKLSVNLVPNAMRALDAAAERANDSRIDTVNRALILYGLVLELAATPDSSAEVDLFRGESYRIRIVKRRWWRRAFSPLFGRETAQLEVDR